jgi:hypothetical protein
MYDLSSYVLHHVIMARPTAALVGKKLNKRFCVYVRLVRYNATV